MIRATPAILRAEEAEEFPTEERCHIRETWNRDDDEGLSIARVRVCPGITTRLHRLRGIAERYLILEGRGRVEVGELQPEVVTPGDLVYIPPGCTQRISNLGEGDLLFFAVCTPRYVPEAYEDMDPAE
ncbi:MAG: cupin domain-containing protein [Pseudomonadota bacterium]|nr:cupin domain-containing protein [Pseudomonadota bacterium]